MQINNADISAEQAKDLCRMCISFMHDHQILPSPENYAISFEYLRTENVELHEAFDQILNNPVHLDDSHLHHLYMKHLASSDATELTKTRKQIGDILRRTLDETSHIEGDLGDYARSLQVFTESQNMEFDISEMAEIFQKIIAETLTVIEAEKQLARDLSQVRDAASKDALTGLFNRGTFDMALASDLDVAIEEKESLSLLIMDIDHFKKVNDTWGHQVGDNVIRSVASTIMESIKGRDFAARYGGEEFVVLLPHTDISGATTVAEHIRKSIEKKCLGEHLCDAPDHPITISLGVASLSDADEPATLLQRADAALYHSKRTGRNRVSTQDDLNQANSA